jgi:ABC-type multidrug transport system permease subunit
MISSIKKSMKIVTGAGLSLFGILYASICQAADTTTSGGFFETQGGNVATIKVVRSQNDLGGNIVQLIDYFLGFLGLIAVAFIIYGGVLMVTSGGNEEGVGKAKKIITYAAIGIVIIMLSYTIVTFVSSALG